MTLDLRGYVDNDHSVTQGPSLHFHRDDPRDHDLCKARGFGSVVKPSRAEWGRWTWVISDADEGVIDIVWDVDGPEKLAHKPDAAASCIIQLVRERLTACRVFEHIMKVIDKFGPVPFRRVEKLSPDILPRSGPGRAIPLSQSQISKLMPRVEELLEDPGFFGSRMRLFVTQSGKIAEPGDKARKALELLRPYLKDLVDEG